MAPPVGVYVSQQVEYDPGSMAMYMYSIQSAPPVGLYISQQVEYDNGTIAIYIYIYIVYNLAPPVGV